MVKKAQKPESPFIKKFMGKVERETRVKPDRDTPKPRYVFQPRGRLERLRQEVNAPGYANKPPEPKKPSWMGKPESELDRYDLNQKKQYEEAEKNRKEAEIKKVERESQIQKAINSSKANATLGFIETLHQNPQLAATHLDLIAAKQKRGNDDKKLQKALEIVKKTKETGKAKTAMEGAVAGLDSCIHHIAVLNEFSNYFNATGANANYLPERHRSIFYAHFNALPGNYKTLTNDLGTLKKFGNNNGILRTPVATIEESIIQFKSKDGIYKRHDKDFGQMVDSAKRKKGL